MRQLVNCVVLLLVFPLIACGQQTDQQPFSIEVLPGPLLIMTTSPLPTAFLNMAYTVTMSAMGGLPPYTWAVPSSSPGPLPPGLMLEITTGTIAGTPSATGSFSFELEVTDSSGSTAIRRFEFGKRPDEKKKERTG